MLLKRKIRTTLDTPLYDRSKWHGPESLWPRCREKKRNREIPWIIKGKEIDIAEGDKVLLNKQRCKKQADTVVINWSDSVRSCVHKKETGVTVQENDASYTFCKCNVTRVNQMMFMLNPLNPMPDVSVISRPVRICKVPSRFKDYLTKTL